MASERVRREEAAADLRMLRCLTAVLGLRYGGIDGRRLYDTMMADLRRQAGEPEAAPDPDPSPRRRRRGGKPE